MAGRIFYAGGAIPQGDGDNTGSGVVYTGSKPINISNDTISLSYDNQTIQLNANGELCTNLDELGNEVNSIASDVTHIKENYLTTESLPIATIDKLGVIKPDGSTISVSDNGVISAISTASIVEQHGIRGDYSTQYGILECPNGILEVDGMTVTLQPMVVMQCAGQEAKTIITGSLKYTITSTDDIDLFYANGELLECGDVFYQETEPDNGVSNYIAWWKPSLGKWQFKSNETGNVFRPIVACKLAHIHTDGTTITRVDYLGNRILDDEIFLEKPKVVENNSTEIVIAKTQPSTAYTYGVITSLSIQAIEKSTVECTIEFTAGENISVTYPQSLKTIGNPTFITGKRYLIAIYNNIMIAGVIDN